MTKPHLILGNARYSSWSMRPYLVLERAGIEYTAEFHPLRTDKFREEVRKVSPFGLVPALMLGDESIADSLAISEWAAEQVPSLWPKDEVARGMARMLAGQMHAGFQPIRRELPMDLGRDHKPRKALSDEVYAEIARMKIGWGMALHRSGGPFLFGDWSIADAFYTPVASRFRTFAIELGPEFQDYCDLLLAQPEFLKWEAMAADEDWVIEDYLPPDEA